MRGSLCDSAGKMDVIHGMFARSAGKPGFDYTGFSRDPLAFLRDAVNYILGLDDGKNVTSMSRWR